MSSAAFRRGLAGRGGEDRWQVDIVDVGHGQICIRGVTLCAHQGGAKTSRFVLSLTSRANCVSNLHRLHANSSNGGLSCKVIPKRSRAAHFETSVQRQ